MSSTAYDKALAYLYSLQKYGIKFGLSSTANLLRRLGNPHEGLKAVHIAGTNGKGSTAAMLSAVLIQAGYSVGLYTSPHLVRFNERFRINDRDVSDEEILATFHKVRAMVDERQPPTYFEMTTAMAFSLFAEQAVDWVVLEVGMGGRLDATNIIRPRIAVITNVSLEHREYLGLTLTAIAREKAGIIKQGAPLVTAVGQPAALAVIKSRCLEARVPWYGVGRHLKMRWQGRGRFSYRGLGWRLDDLRTPLMGRYQAINAATALGALEVLERQGLCRFTEEQLRRGLDKTRWSGRLEWLGGSPPILLDGAHNPAGVAALKRSLLEELSFRRLIVVLGVMADKDLRSILATFTSLAQHIILTRPRYERAAEPEALRELAAGRAEQIEVITPVAAALERARRLAGPGDLVLVTGSLYFIGEVKEVYERRNEADGHAEGC